MVKKKQKLVAGTIVDRYGKPVDINRRKYRPFGVVMSDGSIKRTGTFQVKLKPKKKTKSKSKHKDPQGFSMVTKIDATKEMDFGPYSGESMIKPLHNYQFTLPFTPMDKSDIDKFIRLAPETTKKDPILIVSTSDKNWSKCDVSYFNVDFKTRKYNVKGILHLKVEKYNKSSTKLADPKIQKQLSDKVIDCINQFIASPEGLSSLMVVTKKK